MAQEHAGAEIVLIRHAPALDGGRMAGRRDVPCAPVGPGVAADLRAAVGAARVIASPARRCVATAEALFGLCETDPRLWEQDFGQWEGMAYADLPDLGPLPPEALAAHCPPQGESFAALCDRVASAFAEWSGRVAVVAHAGTVRAALALATGSVAGALAFQVAPLSLTRVLRAPGGWAVVEVNRRFG
ncbi:histidine phosphatase family protein [Paenirhodobacter sp.]|uniref:histidine phosphatase family protein n=1 Tax=Paenirhodobacter sp. TaxID=1965326 RepID=UPI003B3ED250